ncbi:MAG TPA: tetratricopeptide repeat protein [Sphingomicrobium sp.]|jgi:tetratricopeptide (TPR) repeat protein
MSKWVKGGLLAGTLLAAQPAAAEWVEATSDHFVVYGDLKPSEAQSFAEQMERIDKLLRTATQSGDTLAERANKVTIYFVPDMSAVQRLYGAGGGDVGGFYRPDAQGSLAVTPKRVNNTIGQYIRPQQILFHEYAHAILISGSKVSYPRWLNEGLAEFFGTTEVKADGSLVLGGLPLIRGFALAEQKQMTAQEMLTADQRKLSDADVGHLYARSWALVHMLMLNKGRAGQLDAYMRLLGDGVASLDAGKRAFGDLGKLDSDLKVHLRARSFPSLVVPAAKVSGGKATVRTLSRCEAQIMPTRLRSAVGVSEKTAGPVALDARRAAAGCENDAFVQRTLAETEYDAKNYAQSAAASERALAIDPNNIPAMVYRGRVYAQAKDWANARRWFIRANKANPDYALPLVLYHDSFTQAGQAPSVSAQNGLLRALVLVPQDSAVRVRVVRAMVASGDMATARAALTTLAFAPHAKPDDPAAKVLRMIDDGKDKAAITVEMDKAKWNEFGKF